MKNNIKFLALIGLVTLCSFSFISEKTPIIKITEASKNIEVNSFTLKIGTVLLNETESEKIYVKICRKEVQGKKWVANKRVKRKGTRYTLNFVSENKISGKIEKSKTKFIQWNNGEIDAWRMEKELSVGDLTFSAMPE